MLGIKDEIPKKFRIFLLPFLLKPPRALRMRFFRHGWGGGSVKTERGRGEIFKMKLKMGKGGGGGGGDTILSAWHKRGRNLHLLSLFYPDVDYSIILI